MMSVWQLEGQRAGWICPVPYELTSLPSAIPVPSVSSSLCPASGSIVSVTLFAPELQNLLLGVLAAISRSCEGQMQQNHLCSLRWGMLFRDYLSLPLAFGMLRLLILPSCLWQVKWIRMWVAGQSLYIGKNLSERTVADTHKCMAKLEEKYWGQNHITFIVGINRHSQKYFQDFFFFFFCHSDLYVELLDTFARRLTLLLKEFSRSA